MLMSRLSNPSISTKTIALKSLLLMNVLVVLSAAPHPLDPATTYAPTPVTLTAWRSGTAGADDICRRHCAENDRGFINTERGFL